VSPQRHGGDRKWEDLRKFENPNWPRKLTRVVQFINAGSGSNLRIGTNLGSCTTEVQLSNTFTLDGRRVLLADTPGFDDTHRSDTDILRLIAAFLETT
jgi:hypothetical protein